MRTLLRAAAMAPLAALVALTACSSDRQPSTTAPTSARAVAHPDHRRHTGTLIEGSRMAEALVLPTDVLPELVQPGQTGVLTEPMLMISVGQNNAISHAASANGLLTGFITYRSAARTSRKGMTHGVMRFPDAAAATRAADAMAGAALTTRGMLETESRHAVRLTESPETRFSRYDHADRVATMAFTPYREYVIYTSMFTDTVADAAQATARAAVLQRPLLDSFTPTDPAKYAELPYDPDGILELAVGRGGIGSGSYGPHGAALFGYDQPQALALFHDVGMTAMGVSGSNVYRTRDAAAAQRFATALVDSTLRHHTLRDKQLAPAASPPDAAASKCWSIPDGGANSWYCVVAEGRYVGEIWARNQAEAHELTTKQQHTLASR